MEEEESLPTAVGQVGLSDLSAMLAHVVGVAVDKAVKSTKRGRSREATATGSKDAENPSASDGPATLEEGRSSSPLRSSSQLASGRAEVEVDRLTITLIATFYVSKCFNEQSLDSLMPAMWWVFISLLTALAETTVLFGLQIANNWWLCTEQVRTPHRTSDYL